MSSSVAGLHNLGAVDFNIDPTHSRIGFAVRHAMISKVRGAFNEFSGSGSFNPEHVQESSVNVVIEAASIDTRNSDRDAHLASNDFLAAPEHPHITFTSTSVELVGSDILRVHGELAIRGVSRPVSIDFEYTGAATDPFGMSRAGFEGRLDINRKDWGVNWNAALEAGGVLVSDKVTLEFEISAVLSPKTTTTATEGAASLAHSS